MGMHLVLTTLAGNGFGLEGFGHSLPLAVMVESGVNHTADLGLPPGTPGVKMWERADIDEGDDAALGYFALWVWFPEARLDELVADGTISHVVYRDPDPVIEGGMAARFTMGEIASAAAGVPGAKKVPGVPAKDVEKLKVKQAVRSLPQREGKSVLHERERVRRGGGP